MLDWIPEPGNSKIVKLYPTEVSIMNALLTLFIIFNDLHPPFYIHGSRIKLVQSKAK
jgi:hypothetical protein